MNSLRRLILLPALAIGTLVVAACGDDSTNEPATPSTDEMMTDTTEMMTDTTGG